MSEEQAQRHRRQRMIIYIALAVVVLAGFLFPWALKDLVSVEAQAAYDFVERVAEQGRSVVIVDTATNEGQRQLGAALRHLLTKGARVVVISSSPEAAAMAETQMRAAIAAQRLRYGEDAVHLGFRPGGMWIENAARGFQAAAQGHDHAGDDLTLHPITYRFRMLADADLLVVVSDGRTLPVLDAYRLAAHHGVRLMLALTGDSVEQGRALWLEGRVEAVLPGPRATSDYENLVTGRSAAARYLTAMTLGTLFVMALIVWAYLGGLLNRRRRATVGGIFTR